MAMGIVLILSIYHLYIHMAPLFSMSYQFLPLLVTFSGEISYASYQRRNKFFSGRLNLSVQSFLSYPSISQCYLRNLSRSTFCVFRFNSRWFQFKSLERSCTYSLRRKAFFALKYNRLRFILHFLYIWSVVMKRSTKILDNPLGFQTLHSCCILKKMLLFFLPHPLLPHQSLMLQEDLRDDNSCLAVFSDNKFYSMKNQKNKGLKYLFIFRNLVTGPFIIDKNIYVASSVY